MSGVRIRAERIKDEYIQISQLFQGFFRNGTGIRAIGDVSNAEPQDLEPGPVLEPQWNDFCPENFNFLIRKNWVKFDCGNSSPVSLGLVGECVGKRRSQSIFDYFFTEYGYGMPEIKLEQSQVVHTHDVIRMLMRVSNRVDHSDILPEQLRTEIR